MRARRVLPWLVLSVVGCARSTMPDPAVALRAYADAAARGDARAIHGMLSERSRRDLRPADVDRLVAEERAELGQQAKAIQDARAVVRANARVRYADGEDVTLDLEDGVFRIGSVDGLPAAARSPEQALEHLRKALARRSYAGMMRVLSPATRSALETDVRSLVEGLSHPEGLEVDVAGDTAQVRVGGGHWIRLRRDRGLWSVEDFD